LIVCFSARVAKYGVSSPSKDVALSSLQLAIICVNPRVAKYDEAKVYVTQANDMSARSQVAFTPTQTREQERKQFQSAYDMIMMKLSMLEQVKGSSARSPPKTTGKPVKSTLPVKAADSSVTSDTGCSRCGKPSTAFCSRCWSEAVAAHRKKVWYCSRECQKADWSRHKPDCVPLAK